MQRGNAFGGNAGALLKTHPRIFGLRFPAAYDSIGGAETELSKSNRTFGNGCGVEVIELEDSMEAEYHEVNETFATEFRTPVPETLSLFESDSSVMGNNKYCLPSGVHLEEEQDRRFHEHASSVGLGGDSRLAPVNILLSNKHVFRPLLIDLNMSNEEDECYHVQINDHLVNTASPSMNFSIDHHHRVLELDPTKSDKVSFTPKPDSANPASITSSTYDEDSVKLSQTISRDSADKPRNLEGSGGDVLSSHHSTAEVTKFCAEYTSNVMINNNECSSYEKSTEEPATLSTNDDSVITQLHSPKHEISYIGKSKEGGRDLSHLTIAAAAEALVAISSGRAELENSREEELQCAEPQSSSDSFEFMAMQLSEVLDEDQILKGETTSLNNTRKGENGIRLRRGRRLRDFRKDILPGLVSLSRHEICEDLYSIGYSLRKNTSRNARRNWFLPTRSRRRF
ncbi:hypothetical protein KSP40_PGU013048 [Platanthera guangdongensis]|uniref:Uncharacterized protein n=1 Tax=Platanthera guangdongensis TaxID=2320717 RepID=A0ABR2MR31_9ASPA